MEMDYSAFSNERSLLEGEVGRSLFPNLGRNFEVLEPSSPNYNCIAHSLGIIDLWINPETGDPENPFGVMDKKYLEIGFQRIDHCNFELDSPQSKVVLYALMNEEGQIQAITHAAIQEFDGTWTSKLGQGPLIRHETPNSISGPFFGQPVCIYVRRRNGKK